MSDLIVHGGTPLRGRLVPSANKNAVLPILCATLLTQQPVRLRGIPEITDVKKILEIFRMLGSHVAVDYDQPACWTCTTCTRASTKASTTCPRRCAVHHAGARAAGALRRGAHRGRRQGLQPGHARDRPARGGDADASAASVERRPDGIVMRADRPLKANQHWLDYASVTTTENFVLCAALAQGRSVLMNAASEPHVQEFCPSWRCWARDRRHRHLAPGGARRGRAGRRRFTFAEDFHEIVTFLALGAITGGCVEVKNSRPSSFR
jgi:UDP-N-acetylglucosamine 1-carboxyvinyltransferase